MREHEDAALERRLRGVLREHLDALPLDLTVDTLERRRAVRDAARRRRRGLIALGLAAALLVPLGVLGGGGRLLLEAIQVPAPSPSPDTSAAPEPSTEVPSAQPSVSAPTPTPIAQGSWLTARELMDRLSAAYGYQWSAVDNGLGAAEWTSDAVRVTGPLDSPAKIGVTFDVDAAAASNPHVERVVQAVAPDAAPWLQEALTQGVAAGGPFVSTTPTMSGGQVAVLVVDEPVLKDWGYVLFEPDPPPTRGLARDAGLVAYESSGRVWVADRDGTDPGLLVVSTTTPFGISGILGWSADGPRLFYGDAGGGVFAVDAGGSQPFRVGSRADHPLCPAAVAADRCQPNEDLSISPDGSRLAYSIQEGSDSDIHVIAVLDVASGRVTALASTRAPGVDMPTWSPDGTRLVYGCPGVRPRTDGLCVVNADGTGPRQLVPPIAGDISDPRWSPDGSTILFEVDGGGRAELRTIEPDGSGLRSLPSDGLPGFARWTRDGRIVFVRWAPGAAGQVEGRGHLRIVDADGSNASTLGTSIPEQTAAGCLACPYPDGEGRFFDVDHEVRFRYWQPIPGDRP